MRDKIYYSKNSKYWPNKKLGINGRLLLLEKLGFGGLALLKIIFKIVFMFDFLYSTF